MKISGAKQMLIVTSGGLVLDVFKLLPEGSSYEKEPIVEKETNGNSIFNGFKCSLEVTSADMAKFSQLEAWMKSNTTIRVTVYGLSNNINWYEYVPFIVERNYNIKAGGVNSFTIKLAFKGSTTDIYTT